MSQPQVVLHTNRGAIVLELDADRAPKTVGNFLHYVDSGHYDGSIFHRVIDGFMIQGGGFDADMHQKPTSAPIANEAANGLKNGYGTIAMARTGEPHSATAQFFINVADNAFLDYRNDTPQGFGYAVFGRVIEGMDVLAHLQKRDPDAEGGPMPDKIISADVVRKRDHAYVPKKVD